MILQFEKENDNRWFAVIPSWEGGHDDLEMVCGADLLLDKLSDGEKLISVDISEENPKYGNFIMGTMVDHDEFGATYITNEEPTDENSDLDNMFWLCNVTHFVFGEHPQVIYFKVVK